MFPKQKIKASLTKKIVPISLCAVITLAAVKPPVFVYASQPAVQHTLADFINSYMAVYGGTGNVNAASQSYMATNSVMQAPLEDFVNGTYTVADINSACSGEAGVARWTNNIANNSQQVSLASAYLEESGIDSYILDNLTGASVGENLQASIDYYLDHGALKPAFGGQPIENNLAGLAVMQSLADVAYNFDNFIWYAHENGWTDEEITAAMDSGSAFGSLQGAIDYRGNLNKTIVTGNEVDIIDSVLSIINKSNAAVRAVNRQVNNRDTTLIWQTASSEVVFACAVEGNNCYGGYCNTSNSTQYVEQYYGTGENDHNFAVNPHDYRVDRYADTRLPVGGFKYTFSSKGDLENYFQSIKNNPLSITDKSPDIVTKDGQAQGSWTQDANANNRNQFNLNISPNFNPNYNYDVADPTTINNYIQDTQEAIEQGDPQLDIGGILADLVANLQIAINPNPQPTGNPFPTTVPYPTGVPQPTAVPVEDTIPDQPEQEPKPTNTPEEDEKNKQGMATPELALKFPFCIPFDIADMFTMFMEQRRAPQFHIVFDLGSWGEYPLDVDLSPWDEVAALVRLLELIVFIAGLIMVARKLIGDNGG